MSVSVSLERLRDEVARYGAHPFILTVSDGGRPHAVAATVAWEGDQLVGGCGRSTAANASARPDISFLWPPLEPEGYSLIVDGLAAVDDQQIRLSPSRAVLHRFFGAVPGPAQGVFIGLRDGAAVTDEAPSWGGINHLALVTNDMDATVRFYVGTLGARLVATIGNRHFRHYFFEIGPRNTVAFFEYAASPSQPFAKPAGIPDARAPQFDHVSFDLPDEEALLALRNRLKAAACEVTDVVDHGFIRSVYFNDPNGIALEASYWVVDATAGPTAWRDELLFSDPEPVPAVRELEQSGRLSSVPPTHLV